MDDQRKTLEKLKALKNFAQESTDPEVQAMGIILNTVYLAYKNGDTIDLMKVMSGFTLLKIDKTEKGFFVVNDTAIQPQKSNIDDWWKNEESRTRNALPTEKTKKVNNKEALKARHNRPGRRIMSFNEFIK